MTKKFDLSIDKYQAKSFLRAVRTKGDIIVIWMNAIKAFLTNEQAIGFQSKAILSIIVKSMTRLFCKLENGEKIFSIAFPFTVRKEGIELAFYSREGIKIDNRVSSQVLTLVETNLVLEVADFSSFIDPIIDASDVDAEIWILLRELMLAEDGYVRYDWDKLRANGHRHPEHHIDLGYSPSGSFKLGLQGAVQSETLISILDIEVDCHYLLPVERLAR